MIPRFSLWLALVRCRPSRALLGLAVRCRPSRALLGLAVASLAIVLFHAPLARAKGPAPGRPPSAVTSPPPPARTLSDRPPPPKKPLIALATDDGGRGPLVLAPRDGAYTGELRVMNDGAEALVVSRVAIRGDDDDVRAPARLSAHFGEGGGTTATIPPGAEKRVVVTWTPGRASRVRQVLAHVVVTSNDEEAGEVAIGVRAQLATPVPFIADHLLSWLTFLPLAGALLIVLLQIAGWGRGNTARAIALTATALQCLLAIGVASVFRGDVTRLDGNDGFQLIEHSIWVRSFNVEYFVGVDGISVPMVLLTALVGLVGCIASAGIDKQRPGYYALYLLLATGMMGVFVSLDLFLFYVFWQVALLPMYFLIGVWGGPRDGESERSSARSAPKERAATKFFLTMLVGSVLMLLAFLALYASSDRTFLVDGTTALHTFSIPELARVSFAGKHLTIFGVAFVKLVWFLLFGGFAIKAAMFPFHTWLPDAHVEAPTPISVLSAAVLLKMGTYGMLRVNFAILPEATRWAAGAIVALGAVNVVYGAFCAMAQDDVKRMIAYASVSQMGFCLIGIGSLTPQGVAGCLFVMVSHGLVTSMLFLLAGALDDRAHTRSMRAFGGLAGETPLLAALAGLALMASLGLPGLSGFWGEALALLGAFPSHRAIATIAATGLVLAASYNLGAFQKLFLGPLKSGWQSSAALDPFGGRFPDVTARELASLAPLALLTIVLGLWPVPLFSLIAGGVRDATSFVDPPGPDQIASLFQGASHALSMLP
jgi:NADH-quinone oxidoreductase subunit M